MHRLPSPDGIYVSDIRGKDVHRGNHTKAVLLAVASLMSKMSRDPKHQEKNNKKIGCHFSPPRF